MPFEKGHKKATGRPKGSSNKSTQKVRDAFALLLEDNLDTLREDISSLKPAARTRLLLDLAKYVVPTLKSTELKLDEETAAVFNMPVKKFFGVDD